MSFARFTDPDQMPVNVPFVDTRERRHVRVRVVRPFYVGGILRDAGELVTVSECDAHGLVKRGRAEFLS